ncbi:MAG: hypothetical protein IKX42_09515 [Fibrobacter sp.]|nr:hypothetical protein [Fibrobacter sp.]
MNNATNFSTPFPIIADLLRLISRILGTRPEVNYAKHLDRMATSSYLDIEMLIHLKNMIFQLPFKYDGTVKTGPVRNTRNRCELFINKQSDLFFDGIQTLVYNAPSELFESKPDYHKYLIEVGLKIVCDFICDIFCDNPRIAQKMLITKNPLQYGFELVQELKPDFINMYEGEERRKITKWMEGTRQTSMENIFLGIRKNKDKIGDNYNKVCEILFSSMVMNNVRAEKYPKDFDINTVFNNIISGGEYLDLPSDLYRHSASLAHEFFWESQKTMWNRTFVGTANYDLIVSNYEKKCDKYGAKYLAVGWRSGLLQAESKVMEGDYEGAISIFMDVIPQSLYSTDRRNLVFFPFQKGFTFFDLALSVGSICKDGPFLKRMKAYGILFGHFGLPIKTECPTSVKQLKKQKNYWDFFVNKESRATDLIVEDWEVGQWACNFFKMFPKEMIKNYDEIIALKKDVDMPLLINGDEFTEPILSNPGYVHTTDWKKWPQLVWFTAKGDVESVKKLLEANANVNLLTSSGESALFWALEHMTLDNSPEQRKIGKILFDLISGKDHDPKIVNVPINKKKETCLGKAVLCGDVSVVKKLIKMGAKVSTENYNECAIQSTDRETLLYRVVKHYKAEVSLEKFINNRTSPEVFDGLRRQSEFLRGKTNDQVAEIINSMMNNPSMRSRMEDDLKRVVKAFDNESLYEIAKVLLENGADPNYGHNINRLIGNTPLMMAIENRALDMFKLLIEYGGDPTQVGRDKTSVDYPQFNCWDVAEFYKADEILKFLNDNRNRFN